MVHISIEHFMKQGQVFQSVFALLLNDLWKLSAERPNWIDGVLHSYTKMHSTHS